MKISNPRQFSFSHSLLIYMCIIVVLITLIPFTFRVPDKIHITWSTNFPDFITNIILFLPIGFLFRLSHRKNKDRFCIQALSFGILLSLGIEFLQLFIAGRFAQIIDVITNGMGAWLGAMVFVFLMGRLKEGSSVRLFALELPLMNLLYLLIPLMWLNGLSAGEEVARLWLMLLLGLLGCGVLASIYIHRFKDGGNLTPNKLSLFVLSWFVVASLPALVNFPIEVTGIGVIIVIFVQIPARLPLRRKKGEKRFELPTLKILLPLYVIYLILVAVWPTTLPFQEWQFKINFQELVFNERIVFTFRFIELIASFTLFGYMIAEMRGRRKEARTITFAWIFFITLICSVVIEMTTGYPPLLASNILEILFMTASGVYGAMIYRLQLTAIQHL
ncbi:MAG: VanZ family protein [Deltaproteobacteria bacterium]|nr:VanZ family protein [Deltaproteobacteria bacterium]